MVSHAPPLPERLEATLELLIEANAVAVSNLGPEHTKVVGAALSSQFQWLAIGSSFASQYSVEADAQVSP